MADFPEQIELAASTFKSETIAYAQIRADNDQIKLRLQALEVVRQFEGDVTHGRDPKGILFYTQQVDFDTKDANFTYTKLGSGDLVIIVINFYPTCGPHPEIPYARFVAKVLSNQLPDINEGGGRGIWKDFEAGSAQTRAIGISGSPRLNLLFEALKKTVYFDIKDSGKVDMLGIFLFKDHSELKGQCKVIINPDIILFFKPNSTVVIGQFVPAGPIKTGGTDIEGVATWESTY